MSVAPIEALAALGSPETLALRGAAPATAPTGASFAELLMNGLETVNERVANADAMVRSFALGESIPLHQVTFALEEARLSMELMMQVRARLVESYQRMMEMQL